MKNCMKHILYKLTRDDGQIYIGITIDYRFKNRMSQHRSSNNFKGHCFEYEILMEDEARDIIESAETEAVKLYNTYENGLNKSEGGKGCGHNSPNFNTIGFKFSKESRKKMSESAQARVRNEAPNVRRDRMLKVHLENPEIRKKQSLRQRGKVMSSKLTTLDIKNIQDNFYTFSSDLIGSKAANGRVLSKKRLYSRAMAAQYPVGEMGIYKYVRDLEDEQ